MGRAVTGLGVAGTFGGSYIIIGISAPPQHRPALTGFMGSAYAIASVIGPCKTDLLLACIAPILDSGILGFRSYSLLFGNFISQEASDVALLQ